MTRQLKNLAGLAAVAGALVLLGSGCGDKREMSKQNFAHVLNEDYSANADCLFTKRLEQGVFLWPPNIEPGKTLMLTAAQLSGLIDGVDWRAPEQRWRPAVAG